MTYDVALLAERLERALKEHSVPGAQVGLLTTSGRHVVSAGRLAVGSDAAVEDGTRFHAGSIAKALTGEWVLEAAAEGLLDLDTPCSDQAPMSWSDTPRDLLTQTSGRPNELPDVGEGLDEFVARIGATPVLGAGRFAYCNAGWSALDLLLRETTGRGFAQRLEAAGGILREPDDAARGHAPDQDGVPHEVPSAFADAAAAAGACWWATADELLDLADRHLHPNGDLAHRALIQQVRTPAVALPGATVFDAWGKGWASWHRGDHEAFGWAGFTGGHRAYLRCFPRQEAALVVLASCAGGLFGGPGGAALFDDLLPGLLRQLDVPPLTDPVAAPPRWSAEELAGQYGPVPVRPDGDTLRMGAQAFGAGELTLERAWGDTWVVRGNPPGAIPVAFDADDAATGPAWLYLGPFAVPRVG